MLYLGVWEMTKNPAEIAGTRYKNEKLMSRVQKTDGTSRCFAQIENIKRQSLSILGNGVYFLLLIPIGICGYYVNEIFLFKGDKYRKYFAEFAKKKRYLLYYGIYVVSLIIRLATFYLLLASA